MKRICTPTLLARVSDVTSFKKLALLLAMIAAIGLGTTTGHAQNERSWVSNTGTNNTFCTVADPCQTFAQAIAVTPTGGEINCLTPGGFGPVTISESVTINCQHASNGGITGATAITINTAGIVVNLIGLDLDGGNTGGGNGISITAPAAVTIRNCKIYDFLDNGGYTGFGILIMPTASGAILIADNIYVANNGYGIGILNNIGSANITLRNSNINNNAYGILLQMNSGTHAGATIEKTTIAFNSDYGLAILGSGAVALIGGSTVVNNATGVLVEHGAIAYSFDNNQIGGNGTDGTPLTAYPGGLR